MRFDHSAADGWSARRKKGWDAAQFYATLGAYTFSQHEPGLLPELVSDKFDGSGHHG